MRGVDEVGSVNALFVVCVGLREEELKEMFIC